MEDRALSLPRAEPLLRLPISAIVEFVSNRSEAEVLLRIGDLAHEFDHLTASLVQWLEHQQYLKVDSQKQPPTNDPGQSLISSLAPLTHQARVANRHGVKILQQRITECLQQLQRLTDAVQVFADQNASFSQELRICGLEGRAEQRRRLADTESALASRLSKFLGGCDSFYDEQALLLVAGTTSGAVATVVASAASALKPAAAAAAAASFVAAAPVSALAAPAGATAPREQPQQHIRPKVGRVHLARDPEKTIGSNGTSTEGFTGHKRPRRPSGSGVEASSQNHDAGIGKASPVRRDKCCKQQQQQQLSQGENDYNDGDDVDGFAAPSFLTPPVAGAVPAGASSSGGGAVRDTTSGLHAAVGFIATPHSACSSLGSTPSNGSSSPAIAVTSPLPVPKPLRRKSLDKARRGGTAGAGPATIAAATRATSFGIVSSSRMNNRRARAGGGGGCGSGADVSEATTTSATAAAAAAAAPAAPLSEDQLHSSGYSSPTPPSTREPSPPPLLSTQEGSVSAAEGDENEDGSGHREVVWANRVVDRGGDDNDGRVMEHEGGEEEEEEEEEEGWEGEEYSTGSGEAAQGGHVALPRQQQLASETPRLERQGRDDEEAKMTEKKGRHGDTAVAGEEEAMEKDEAQQEAQEAQEEQGEREEQDMPDTADTVEDSIDPAALAAAAVAAEEAPCRGSQDGADEAGGTDPEATVMGGGRAPRFGRRDGVERDL